MCKNRGFVVFISKFKLVETINTLFMKTSILFFLSMLLGCQFAFSQFGAEFAGYNADNESFGMQPMLQYAFLQMESKLLTDDGKMDIKGISIPQ